MHRFFLYLFLFFEVIEMLKHIFLDLPDSKITIHGSNNIHLNFIWVFTL